MDVAIISPKSRHPDWTLQEVNIQLLGIGTLSQAKQSPRWIKCIGSKRYIGKVKSYVAK